METEKTKVWLLIQVRGVKRALSERRLLGVYDNEVAAALDRDRLDTDGVELVVEEWTVDTEPVASRDG